MAIKANKKQNVSELGFTHIHLSGNQKVDEIRQLHQMNQKDILDLSNNILSRAIRIGELLVELKSERKHGNWEEWIVSNLPFGERQAQKYIRVYKQQDKLKANSEFAFDSLNSISKYLANPNLENMEDKKIAKDKPLKDTLKAVRKGKPVEKKNLIELQYTYHNKIDKLKTKIDNIYKKLENLNRTKDLIENFKNIIDDDNN